MGGRQKLKNLMKRKAQTYNLEMAETSRASPQINNDTLFNDLKAHIDFLSKETFSKIDRIENQLERQAQLQFKNINTGVALSQAAAPPQQQVTPGPNINLDFMRDQN
jgi:hypothetical protein